MQFANLPPTLRPASLLFLLSLCTVGVEKLLVDEARRRVASRDDLG